MLAHVVPQRTGVGVECSVGRHEPNIGPERRESVRDLDGRVRTAREVANTHARQQHVQAGPIGEFRSDHEVDRAEPRDEAVGGAVSILCRHLRKVIGEPALTSAVPEIVRQGVDVDVGHVRIGPEVPIRIEERSRPPALAPTVKAVVLDRIEAGLGYFGVALGGTNRSRRTDSGSG